MLHPITIIRPIATTQKCGDFTPDQGQSLAFFQASINLKHMFGIFVDLIEGMLDADVEEEIVYIEEEDGWLF